MRLQLFSDRPRRALAGLALMAIPVAGLVFAPVPARSEEKACPDQEAGITLPKGFSATLFADKIGHARELVVTKAGTVSVNTWRGV